MSIAQTTRERGPNGRWFHGEAKPLPDNGAYIPLLTEWTTIAVLDDATRQRQGSVAGTGFHDVLGAPLTKADADYAYERGKLQKATRRVGKGIEVVYRTPLGLRGVSR